MQNISKQYFDLLNEFASKFLTFLNKLETDKEFSSFLKKVKGIENITSQGHAEVVRSLFLIDICKCFNLISNLYDYHSKESFAIIFLVTKQSGLEVDSYDNIHVLYTQELLAAYKTMYDSIRLEFKDANIDDEAFFRLAYILNAYDKDLKEEYLANLYQFASIVIKADRVVTAKEEQVLQKIMKSDKAEIKRDEQTLIKSNAGSNQTLAEVMEELNSLTGLSGVKAEINALTNFIRVQKAREAAGLKGTTLSYHVVFTGNPGTGKTTVARLIAKIYKCLGVLSQGHLVETDRSGLVAEYTGQTSVKVHKIIDSAINGVLFIDEAYALAGGQQDSFGKEAVDTLIKRMEDDLDKLAVILAGYTDDMNRFIDTNPGFKSRINRYIEFSDYDPEELLAIFKQQCRKLDYHLTDGATKKVYFLFEDAYKKRDKTFGNGRFVRNIFEKTLEKQADRIASIASLSKETLTTIKEEDIPTTNI